MAIKIDRNTAILKICSDSISLLCVEERESYILDWWGLDEDDTEYHELDAALQNKLHVLDEPDDSLSTEYDPLIQMALRQNLYGTTNRYLEQQLHQLTSAEHLVEGDIELMQKCPCCDYLTMKSKTGFEICPLCKWEYTGEAQDKSGGPNHMSLSEGRAEFRQKNIVSTKWRHSV